MAYLYVDDSKHHTFGFSLAAFVICDTDPTEYITSVFQKLGYDPEEFEYKSSAKMVGDRRFQDLREALKSFIGTQCKIAVCVVDGDKRLGPASLSLLSFALSHPKLEGQSHKVFFDEGLFRSAKYATIMAEKDATLGCCELHFEQDSRLHLGIQLADIVAHTCSTMLLETLGHVTKKVTLNRPGDSVYHGLEVELGFEMWAGIRYAFLAKNKQNPKDDFDLANVDVYPWGLFIDDSVSEQISNAAMERFGENYLGCIH
ncbi:DUF3800 domain-containing protein [uncultured Cohaesibacter sp.]|uniref:DUF3800 domain-containing protein n=1 Tax=uncultured Cohaesibacter sp. TaxID=1002546 RepID=UPI0029C67555|nr:DUF3800 domain-containing protein [uncultured Cohaesibacter sp.]